MMNKKNIIIVVILVTVTNSIHCMFNKLKKYIVTSVSRDKEKLNTQLFISIENNDYKEVQRLLFCGANVNAQNIFKEIPLHVAAENGYADLVELLLDHSANVNAQNKYGEKPLHKAVYNKNAKTTKLLLDCCAEVHAQTISGKTPLHIATYNGSANLVELLLDHGANVNAQTKINQTPLHLAAMKGYTNITQLLLDHGAVVNAQNKYGNTALSLATRFSALGTAFVLLDHDADLEGHAAEILNDNTSFKGDYHTGIDQDHLLKGIVTCKQLVKDRDTKLILALEKALHYLPNVIRNIIGTYVVKYKPAIFFDEILLKDAKSYQDILLQEAIKKNNINGVQKAIELGAEITDNTILAARDRIKVLNSGIAQSSNDYQNAQDILSLLLENTKTK